MVEHKCINGWHQLTKQELQIKDIKMLWKERAGLNYANEIIFSVLIKAVIATLIFQVVLKGTYPKQSVIFQVYVLNY